MIVNDDTVSKALAYLAVDPHPIALAKKDMTDAENATAKYYAEQYLQQTGSIDQRKCSVHSTDEFFNYKNEEAKALFSYERHKARVRAAEMIIDIWRTQNANARAAERVR
jgi:hypothetical protein